MLFYLETLGCQMNKLDSELVAGLFLRAGYQTVEEPERADVAILNTCSVRDHAEQKALSRLGHFHHLRQKAGKPGIIAMMGCFAQRSPEQIRARVPFLDVLCGPNQIHQLAELVAAVRQEREKSKATEMRQAVTDFRSVRSGKADLPADLENLDLCRPMEENQYQRFVRVQRGCDKFCSYCVVPYVRGPEKSRPVEHILEEVRRLDQTGCREVTLIGQTISSYRYVVDGNAVDLPELLYRVHRACAIPRIRFITSYPADFSLSIFKAMAELDRICPYLHLPAQHGSNRMLELMNRKYSVEQYLELLDQGRAIVPNLSVAGDFIVGFPTETDEDHAGSLALLEKVRYKNCFIFKYSVRPGTLAEKKFPADDQVPADTISRRHAEMMDLQERIACEDNQALVGTSVRVLVEGPSKKSRPTANGVRQLIGRTGEDKIVVFDGPEALTGRIQTLRIASASALTLFAEPLTIADAGPYV